RARGRTRDERSWHPRERCHRRGRDGRRRADGRSSPRPRPPRRRGPRARRGLDLPTPAEKERVMKRWTSLLVTAIVSMTAPAVGQEKIVHFSSINGQTGQSAAYGSKVIEGVDLAAKTINEVGGFTDKCGTKYKVKITTGDMANSREQAVSLLRQAA